MPETEHAPATPRWIGWVVLGLGLFVALSSAWTSYLLRDQELCQSRLNSAFRENLVRRAHWADEDRQAMNKLVVESFTKPQATPRMARAYQRWQVSQSLEDLNALVALSFQGNGGGASSPAFREWQQTVQENNRLRAQHPIRPIPPGVCED